MLRKANTLLLDFQRYRSSRGPRFRHITTLRHFKFCVLAFQNVLIFENPMKWRLVTNRWKSRLGTRKDTKKWATARWEGHRLHLSTVRHESPPHWIFKSKDVLESQDADLEMSQGSYVPKNLSTWRTMPLKSSKILSNPFKSFEILPISIVWQIVVILY